MSDLEHYLITARNTKGCLLEFYDYFPISMINGNEDYYINTTQSYLDAFDNNVDNEMDIPDEIYRKDENNHYTAMEILNIARDFLSTLDEQYVKDFDDMINTGHLIMTDPYNISNGDKLDTDDLGAYDRPFQSELRNEVIFPMHNRITDVGVLIHEFMHYELDLRKSNKEPQSIMKIFHEMNSIFHEYLLYDYLNSKGMANKECSREILKRLYYTKLDAQNINLDSKIILITKNRLPTAGLEYDYKESKKIFTKLRESCFYYFGGAYGAVLYDRYKKGIISYKNVKNFVDAIPSSGSDDMVLNYIFDNEELEFTNEEINDSLHRLTEEFEINSLNSKKVL